MGETPTISPAASAADKERNQSTAWAVGEIARVARSEIGGCDTIEIIACGNIEIAVACAPAVK